MKKSYTEKVSFPNIFTNYLNCVLCDALSKSISNETASIWNIINNARFGNYLKNSIHRSKRAGK